MRWGPPTGPYRGILLRRDVENSGLKCADMMRFAKDGCGWLIGERATPKRVTRVDLGISGADREQTDRIPSREQLTRPFIGTQHRSLRTHVASHASFLSFEK